MAIEVLSSIKTSSEVKTDKNVVVGTTVKAGGNITSGGNVTDGYSKSIKKNADDIAAMSPKFLALVPIGSIIPYAGALPSNATTQIDGFLACSGQTLSKTSYPELFAVIGRTYTDSSVSSSNFQLPNLNATGRFLRATGTDNPLGTVQTDGLPNITGNTGNTAIRYDWTLNGSFYVDTGTLTYSGFDSGEYGALLKFDASRSSSVYQNGVNEVRPKSLSVNWLIRVK